MLFDCVGYDMFDPYEVGVGVTPDLVWVEWTRWGKKKASVI